MKTLYIHIGMPKTGTTALQKFLELNAEFLYEKGFIFRPLPFHDYGTDTHVVPPRRNGFFLHGQKNADTAGEQQNIARLEQGLSLIEKWFEEKDNVLLTDEAIYGQLGKWDFCERIRDFARAKGIEPRIVVYLRRQEEFMDSFYRQRVKGTPLTKTMSEFVAEDQSHLDYEKPLRYLESVFGKERILARIYDPGKWKEEGSSVYQDFFEVLGISYEPEMKFPDEIFNPSLSHAACELKRLMNYEEGTLPPDMRLDANLLFRHAAEFDTSILPDQKKYSFLSDEEEQKLKDRVKDSDAWVAQTFFGRNELFPDPGNADRNVFDSSSPEFTENTILYLGYVTAKLYERYLDQQRRLDSLRRWNPFYWIAKVFRKLKARKKKD